MIFCLSYEGIQNSPSWSPSSCAHLPTSDLHSSLAYYPWLLNMVSLNKPKYREVMVLRFTTYIRTSLMEVNCLDKVTQLIRALF